MSILIKGMEMPKDSELLCINIYPSGKVCIGLDLNCEQIATAVPVPPHGRLIDADAFSSEMKERQTEAIKWMRESVQNHDAFIRAEATVAFLSEVKLTLDKIPTIIPAEEGTP